MIFCRASFYVILTFYRRESISSLSLCEADSKMGLEMQEVYWRKYLGRIKEGLMAGGVGGGAPLAIQVRPTSKARGRATSDCRAVLRRSRPGHWAGGTRPSKEVPARGGRGSGPVPPREDRPRVPGAGRGPASQRPCSQPSAPCGGSSQIRASRSAARPTFLWSLVPLFLSRRTGSRPPSSRGQRGMKHARN